MAMSYGVVSDGHGKAYIVWADDPLNPAVSLNAARKAVRAALKPTRQYISISRKVLRVETADAIRKRGDTPPAGL